ncbi:MAG: hypothetical protein ABSG25_15525 [Bryobacteraceae bacterium]
MNCKRFVLASLAVFVAREVLDFLVHEVLLKSTYQATKYLWRPDMASKMWILWLSGFVVSFLFAFIFIKGYEGKGISEGARFGLVIGLFVAIPMALNTYATMLIPHMLAVKWLVYGIVENVILGIVAAAVYRPTQTAGTAAASVNPPL